MDGGFDNRAHALFEQAVVLSPDERDGFLASACDGDAALRTQVEQLLKWDADAGDFLEQGPVVGSIESPGATVGAYTLIREIGEGGMAIVWLASQSEPVSRHVAVKMLKPGMDTRSILSRFELERQVLAHLDHPHVASIFDAGMTERGRPYFVMEFVDGSTLTSYCRERALGITERLTLFMQVCDVVQHAHQKGIIHRDIKPTNILVSTESGAPKVIDFGIAKAVAGMLREGPEFTELGQVVGTPEYMSPEQCSGGVDDIDVRTDVYSLGVVLYEMLCGRVPYDLSSSIQQSVQIVRTQPAIRPSTVDRRLGGDLETILLKALEKRPEDRYQSALDFRRDIERYLEHLPIEARPRSIVYHVRMFTRRHRPLVAAAAVAVASLLAVVGVSWRAAIVARSALHESEQRERDLEVVTSFQESLLSDIDVREMGEQMKAALAESLVDEPDAFEALSEEVNFTTIALRLLDESMLQRARDSINEQFDDQPLIRARLLHRLAGTMNRLGLHEGALDVLRQALAIRRGELGEDHEDTIRSTHAVGSVLSILGDYETAHRMLAEAHERSTRVSGPDDAQTLSIGTSLGGIYREQGDLAGAERVWASTLEQQRRVLGDDHRATWRTMNNIAIAYAMQGKLDDAESMWRTMIELCRRSDSTDEPVYLGALSNLGMILADRGRYDEAMPLFGETLAAERAQFGDTHTRTLQTMAALASIMVEAEDYEGAEPLLRDALAGRLMALDPTHPYVIRTEAMLAYVLHKQASDPNAEQVLRDAFALQYDVQGIEHQDTMQTLDLLSEVAEDKGRLDESLEFNRQALEASVSALGEDHWETGMRLSRRGELVFATTGEADAAAALLRDGHAILMNAVGADHRATREAAARLASFYGALDAEQPGMGYGTTAAQWRARSELPE